MELLGDSGWRGRLIGSKDQIITRLTSGTCIPDVDVDERQPTPAMMESSYADKTGLS